MQNQKWRYAKVSYTLLMPHFDEVTIDTNPVATQGIFKISIAVSEQNIELYPEEKYSGEFYLAEV